MVSVYNALIVNHCKLVPRCYLSVRISVSADSVCVWKLLSDVGCGGIYQWFVTGSMGGGSSGRQFRVFFFRRTIIMLCRDLRRWKAWSKANPFPGVLCLLWLLVLLLFLLLTGIKLNFWSVGKYRWMYFRIDAVSWRELILTLSPG